MTCVCRHISDFFLEVVCLVLSESIGHGLYHDVALASRSPGRPRACHLNNMRKQRPRQGASVASSLSSNHCYPHDYSSTDVFLNTVLSSHTRCLLLRVRRRRRPFSCENCSPASMAACSTRLRPRTRRENLVRLHDHAPLRQELRFAHRQRVSAETQVQDAYYRLWPSSARPTMRTMDSRRFWRVPRSGTGRIWIPIFCRRRSL